MNLPRHKPGSGSGFTLIEMLLAVAICAIVLVAINGVFATAMRLRDRTTALVDASGTGAGYSVMDALSSDLPGRVARRGLQLAGAASNGRPMERAARPGAPAWISTPPPAPSATRRPGVTCRRCSMS